MTGGPRSLRQIQRCEKRRLVRVDQSALRMLSAFRLIRVEPILREVASFLCAVDGRVAFSADRMTSCQVLDSCRSPSSRRRSVFLGQARRLGPGAARRFRRVSFAMRALFIGRTAVRRLLRQPARLRVPVGLPLRPQEAEGTCGVSARAPQ